MSGFCGQFNRDGRPATAEDLASSMEALAHHGRDGHGVWFGGPVAFGHQMLHVTPESMDETLPCRQPHPPLAITGDFRLDNRAELLAELDAPRESWAALPDSAIILRAYARWGVDCADRLLGDFAFVVWDETAQHLFCARDFIGAKPFYYHATPEGFYFAGDIVALLAFDAVSDELDLRYARSYLEYGRFYHLEYSFFQDVRKLPPGHTLTVSARGLDKCRYWLPEGSPEIRYARDEEYFEHLRALLDEAVGARLRSAFPVGSHLSGGLDSSTVAVLAARRLKQRGETLHGFSWSPPPAESEFPLADERALIETICEAEGIIPVYTPTQSDDLIAIWTRDITRHPEHTLRWEVTTSRIAEAMGKRVLLSGWGGDEGVTFNGRGYLADLFRHGRWITMTRELALRSRVYNDDFWGNLKSRVILPLLPDGLVRRLRPALMDVKPAPLPVRFLQPVFATRLSRAAPYPPSDLRERPGARNYQIRLLHHGHLTERMESWADNGGQRGLEYRFPLLDRRVVEFALGIPGRLYNSRGWKRYLFRQTASGVLPEEVSWHQSKIDPALNRAILETADEEVSLLLKSIVNRQPHIQRAGFVNDDMLLEQIKKSPKDIPEGEEVWRVLWLARLD
jgi:asparagine synthase (glutamine-hydrolysing)